MTNAPRTALILGMNGSFARHTARALTRHGWRLKGLVRDPAKLPADLATVEIVAGDLMDADSIYRAAQGVDVIVYGVNPPYPAWEKTALPLFQSALDAAAATGARIVLPGNVYNYDPKDGPVITETSPQNPVSRKGQIRVEMEQKLEQIITTSDARALILRAGDFFGPEASSGWLSILAARAVKSAKFYYPGDPETLHSWAYLPDLAETLACLLEKETEMPDFARFHFEGHETTATQMTTAMSAALGRTVTLKRMPLWPVHLLAPLIPMLREVREMLYLWHDRLALGGRNLSTFLGAVPHTPLEIAIAASLEVNPPRQTIITK